MSDPNMTAEKHAYWEGVASQQAKIDLLEKELTETQAFLNNQNHIKQAKIDELQARVDSAEKAIMICEEYDHAEKLNEIYNLLKGNKDEN